MGGGKGGGSGANGYNYYLTMISGLCRGPIDELMQINVGGIRAWPIVDSSPTTLTDLTTVSGAMLTGEGPGGVGIMLNEDGTSAVVPSSNINTLYGDAVTSIDAPNLFGGNRQEGGIQGSMSLLMGSTTQTFLQWVKDLIGGRVSDLRGIATVTFDGLVASLNPYPKPWKFRVRRVLGGWDGTVWHPELAVIWKANDYVNTGQPLNYVIDTPNPANGTIKSMNPAHVVYEALTNRVWGRGLPREWLDDASFLATAQTLYNEALGFCYAWQRQEDIQKFVQMVLDHMGGALYADRETGLLKLDLLRGNYDPATLPVFDYNSGLLGIDDAQTLGQYDLINEVVVDYMDPIYDQKLSGRVHNLAAMQSVGVPISRTTSYLGAPCSEIALRLAQRDLKAGSTALKRYSVKLDRRAWRIVPGSVFIVKAPDRGIIQAIVRAGKITESAESDGTITVDAMLDVFGLSDSIFSGVEISTWSPPNRSAQVANNRIVREATYGELVQTLTAADLATVDISSGTVAAIAGKPTALSQAFAVSTEAAGETAFVERGSGSFMPYARLSLPLDPYTTSLSFLGATDLGLVKTGIAVQIDDEIVRLDAITSADSVTGFATIARGCSDTIPAAHGAGAIVYFLAFTPGSDVREYAVGDSVGVKLLTKTSSNQLAETLAPTDTLNIVARQGLPIAPAGVKINGVDALYAASVTGPLVFTWNERNRLTVKDQLIETGASTMSPEAGTTYELKVVNAAGVLKRTVSAISGTTTTYASADIATDGFVSGDAITFTLAASRGGSASYATWNIACVLA